MTAKEIGRLLNISHNTVAMHWKLARQKLNVRRKARRNEESPAADALQLSPTYENSTPGLDWASKFAATALFFGALLTLLLLLVIISIIVAALFDLDVDEPYYGLLD